MTVKLSLATLLRVWLAALLSTLVALTPLRAHEVQPAVMDIEIGEGSLTVALDWMIEAAVAGLDLEGLENTNDADNEGDYLALRALPPAQMEAAFRDAWPSLRDKLTFRAGETDLAVEITAISIPEVGNTELPRTSNIALSAALPSDGTALVIGWTGDLGPLVVRQRTVEGGYAGYLTSGALTDPIPRSGTEDTGALRAFLDYIATGFDHIVPKGLDHILFVLGLFFLSTRMRPLLWQVTAFTLAHTVTLALGAMDLVRVPPGVVEPLIAASIVYVGIENTLVRTLHPWRPAVVFGFGLLHGLGFAAVLQDFGLGASHFVPKLIGFNIGVELGQLAVISAAWLTLGLLFGTAPWYHRRIAAPVSLAIAAIAAFWVLDRTGLAGAGLVSDGFTALTEGQLPPFATAAYALGVAALITLATLLRAEDDALTDGAGIATSAALFIALTATFTAGAWITCLVLAAAWALALRLQALGGPDRPNGDLP